MNAIRHYFKSLMLWELLMGMRLTGRYLFAKKFTILYPEEKTPDLAALPRSACAAPLSERRRTLHRLQTLRGRVSGLGDYHRVRAARRRHAPYHAL